MQDSIRKILRRFKEHDPIRFNNKENLTKPHQNNHSLSLNKSQKFNARVIHLQTTIDCLVTDGNRVIKYYQDIIHDLVHQNQILKEDLSLSKETIVLQKRQFEVQMAEMNNQIHRLNDQIAAKSIQYHDLFVKYEQFEEKAQELLSQDQKCIRSIKKKVAKESFRMEEKLAQSESQIEKYKEQLMSEINKNQELVLENQELKRQNQHLLNSIQKLQPHIESPQVKTGRKHQLSKSARLSELQCQQVILEKEDFDSVEKLKILGDSSQQYMYGSRQVLDISEYYSKFNRTDMFASKQKDSFEEIANLCQEKDQKSIDIMGKSYYRRGYIQGVPQNNSQIIKIATAESGEEGEYPLQDRKIEQIPEFQMNQTKEQFPMIDPYRAFFILLTQCEKMNSPNFASILDKDLSQLYDRLVAKCIPYNKWQQEIRLSLKLQCKRRAGVF